MRKTTCEMLRQKNSRFLHRIIAGDGMWITPIHVVTPYSKKNIGLAQANVLKALSHMISTQRRLCCVFGVI